MAAIEVVDDRYEDYRALDVPTLIADDFFNAACVLGVPVAAWRDLDLAALRGRMSINGADVGTGRGGDILGHLLEALAWLANALVARGSCLESGEFVLLGSVVETRWVGAGDRVEVEIEGSARRARGSPRAGDPEVAAGSVSTAGARRIGRDYSFSIEAAGRFVRSLKLR